jgi:hypothetical protein
MFKSVSKSHSLPPLHSSFIANVVRMPTQTMHNKTGRVAHTKQETNALVAWKAWGYGKRHVGHVAVQHME